MAGVSASLNAAVLILCGAINALLSKVVYQLQGQDCSGETKPFQKPWLQTALMFVAMAFCLPIGYGIEAWQKHNKRKNKANSSGDRQRRGAGGQAGQRKVIMIATDAAAAAEAPLGLSGATAATAGNAGDLSVPLLAARAQDRLLQQHHNENNHGDDHDVSGSGSSSGAKFILKEGLLLCIPTGFDLAATTLMNVGLLYVAASVFQILRGSEMLFAALFAVLFLKRRLNRWHFAGVALCMAGISLVGVSRVLAGNSDSSGGSSGGSEADSLLHDLLSASSNSSSSSSWMLPSFGLQGVGAVGDAVTEGGGGGSDPKKALLGMLLIILSQAIQAGQVTVEDHFMSEMGLHPLKVVGWEGVIGSVVMLGGALPLLQRLPFEDGSGLAEDSVGSWCMVKSSSSIAVVLFLSSAAVLVYNISGMYVTEQVGAAARTVLENARTLLVWLAALGLYYMHIGGGAGGVSIGEAWDAWSWLQAVGFAVFAAGALLYDKGHKQEEEASTAAGQTPNFSKWAVLKSTLNIHTGHFVGLRTFRAAANSVMAAQRLARLAEEGEGDTVSG